MEPQPQTQQSIDRRMFEAGDHAIELRAKDDGKTYVRGYFAPFGKFSHVLYGMFREKIAPEAFDQVIDGNFDTVALLNHNSDNVLARKSSKRLTLGKDEYGAFYEFPLPDTTLGRDLKVNIENGDISGSSFAFELPPDGSGSDWQMGADAIKERTITRVSALHDVGPVTFPAYPDSTTGVLSKRSVEEAEQIRHTKEEEENTEKQAAEQAVKDQQEAMQKQHNELTLRLRLSKAKK